MTDVTVLSRHGPLLVFLTVLLDQAGIPVPALPLVAACGAHAARGEMSLALVLIAATLASLAADLAWFALGRWQGRRVIKIFSLLSLHPSRDVSRLERTLRRHGLASVAVAKFFPGLATIAPPLAGALGLPAGRFVVVSALTGLAWSSGVVAGGWLLEDAISEVTCWLETLGGWALALLGLVLFAYVAFTWWHRRREVPLQLGRFFARTRRCGPRAG